MKTAEGGGEYGRMPMTVVRESTLFSGEPSDSQLVWMSHGDEAVKLPEGFAVVARSEQGAIVAIENPARRIFGLQYHPEVVHRWVLPRGQLAPACLELACLESCLLMLPAPRPRTPTCVRVNATFA